MWSLVVAASCVLVSFAQEQTWRVFFRDKGPEPFRVGSSLYERTLQQLSPRARMRRAWVRPPDSLVTLADAPLYGPYVDSVQRLGASVWLQLRWNNYAVVRTDSTTVERLRQLSFVRAVQPTGQIPLPLPSRPKGSSVGIAERGERSLQCGAFEYGASWRQLQMLEIPLLHRMGLTGDSVLIGLLDTGFRWRDVAGLQHVRVRGEWDFLGWDSVTANQGTDHPLQDAHGTVVLSVLAALRPGELIGVAPTAGYLLAKTEDITAERHIEEDAYAAAVEWMEAQGVDILSSSLGYRDFDAPEESYTAEQLDGRTTIVARAIGAAAERGVLCLTAMGNDGVRGLNSPADADSAVAVAAVDSAEQRAPFSSVGFRRGERVRPTVAAMGVAVVAIGPEGRLLRASGTSMATPLVAGALALLREARPDLPPWTVRQAMLQTASRGMQPDTLVGHGVPRLARALAELGGAIGPPAVWELASGAIRLACFGLIPFSVFRAWLQWAPKPSEEALTGTLLLRAVAQEELMLLYGDLPRALLQDSVWVRIRVVGLSGQSIASRWYLLPSQPSIPCGMEIPEGVYRGEATPEAELRLFPNPLQAGRECIVHLPGVHPASRQPAHVVCLWDMLGRAVLCLSLPALDGVGEWTVRLPTVGLSAGPYWVEACYGQGREDRLRALLIIY